MADKLPGMKDYVVPTILLLGTLFFGYLYLQSPEKEEMSPLLSSGGSSKGQVAYNKLREYQKETSIKTDLQRQREEMNRRLNTFEISEVSKDSFHKTELPGPDDPRMEVFEEGSTEQAMNLDQDMDMFLAKRQEYENMKLASKKAYVSQFIREAYKMGFIVKVNDQMEIESVVEIKRQ